MTTLIIASLALAVPFSPLGGLFGFVRLPLSYILLMLVIVALYILAAELAKRVFYRYARP